MWINFARLGVGSMYMYFSVILIGVSIMILFCPFPILYWRARFWFLTACVSVNSFETLHKLNCIVAAVMVRIVPC
jgi:hypothetical protein